MENKILLVGPDIGNKNSYYGGGRGGYTRNMALYLEEFQYENIKLIPFFTTSRKKNDFFLISFLIRFIKDIFGFIFNLFFRKVNAVHILGQYRMAIPREAAFVLISKLFRIPVIYEIKAGKFITFSSSSFIKLILKKFIIKKSELILCEGRVYVDYLKEKFQKESFYFPNVVSKKEIPPKRELQLKEPIKILFVGYCYEGKGIFDLIRAINYENFNIKIELEIIGAESHEFSLWINDLKISDNLNIIRYGLQEHSFVLERMKYNDIYCYPTKHPGEGHNNTINEALMNNMIIIASDAGFLGDILNDCAFVIEKDQNPEEKIREYLLFVINNPQKATNLAKKGREKIENLFNSNVQGKILEKHYEKILKRK